MKDDNIMYGDYHFDKELVELHAKALRNLSVYYHYIKNIRIEEADLISYSDDEEVDVSVDFGIYLSKLAKTNNFKTTNSVEIDWIYPKGRIYFPEEPDNRRTLYILSSRNIPYLCFL